MLLRKSSRIGLESIEVFDVVCAHGIFAIQPLDGAMWLGEGGQRQELSQFYLSKANPAGSLLRGSRKALGSYS